MKRFALFATFCLLFTTACQESLEEKCTRECVQYTQRNCPARIDANTIIDSLTFERPTHTIHYYYTLVGTADSVGLLKKDDARKALLEQLQNTTSMQAYKEDGYRFAYTYHSQRRPELVLIDVVLTKKDYAKAE